MRRPPHPTCCARPRAWQWPPPDSRTRRSRPGGHLPAPERRRSLLPKGGGRRSSIAVAFGDAHRAHLVADLDRLGDIDAVDHVPEEVVELLQLGSAVVDADEE